MLTGELLHRSIENIVGCMASTLGGLHKTMRWLGEEPRVGKGMGLGGLGRNKHGKIVGKWTKGAG